MLKELASLYNAQFDKYQNDEAVPLYKRSLAILQTALGPEHPQVGAALHALGTMYSKRYRYAEAEPLIKRALTISEKAHGAGHPAVGVALNNLALLYSTQERYAEAKPLYERSLRISETAYGHGHSEIAGVLGHYAEVPFAQGDWAEALVLFRRSIAILAADALRRTDDFSKAPSSKARQLAAHSVGLIKALFRMAEKRPGEYGALAREASG